MPSIAASLGVAIGDLYEESKERSATLARLEAVHAELRRALELNPERIEINVYVAGESPGQPEAISDAALVTGLPGSWIADRLAAGLAPYTVWRLHATLRAGPNRALKADPPILARNPASLVDPIQYELEEIDPLSALDARRVLQATRETTDHALYAVALGLGLREGELLGPRVEETAVKAAVRILDESLGGGDFDLEIAPSGTAWKNVSQILFATAIYLWSRARPAPRKGGVPSTLASASSVGGHA